MHNEQLIPKVQTAREFGVTPRTLDRWRHDERLQFPQGVCINGRWYFQRGALEAWKISRARASVGEAA